MRKLLAAAAVVALALAAGACGDSDGSNAREDIEDAVGGASARAAGESMRVALEAQNLDGDKTLRDIDVLQENADDVPGDPTVSGIADGNGDGKDDDGKVGLMVGDQSVCVVVTAQNDVSVEDGPCAEAA